MLKFLYKVQIYMPLHAKIIYFYFLHKLLVESTFLYKIDNYEYILD